MENVTITINEPVLLPGETFNVKYKMLPDGPEIDAGSQTNDPFVLSDLEPGEYLLIVSFVTDEGAECPDVTRTFIVPSDDIDKCECPLIESIYVQKFCEGGASIKVTFEDVGNSICNTLVRYSLFPGAPINEINYPTLPPYIEIPMPNAGSGDAPLFGLEIQCCDGTTDECYPLTKLIDIRDADCDCVPPLVTDAWINYDPVTDTFKLCFNFTGSDDADVSWAQDFGGTDQGSDTLSPGYYEIDINPANANPFQDVIIYSVNVFNTCGRSIEQATIRRCGELIQYQGGQTFPTEFSMLIPAISGTQNIQFNSFAIPDKLEILLNGVSVLDTGYVGSTAYQTELDSALTALGEPTETITATTGIQNLSFTNTAQGIMTVRIYAPLPNTGWDFYAKCE